MANWIVTNFCIGTEQDRRALGFIAKETAREKYSDKVRGADLEAYLDKNFNDNTLRLELNKIANQTLAVYVDGQIAGYAQVTTKGERPDILDGKSVVRIANFSVLQKFDETEARKKLFEKCLCLCGTQKTIWISEYDGNPDLDFFSEYGFVKTTATTGANELGLRLVHLVKA